LTIDTRGQGFSELTEPVAGWVKASGIAQGLLTVFCRHTSASLTIQENADPDVRTDLLTALDRLAPRAAGYVHATEGPDDMPAHIRTLLSGVTVTIPVVDGRPALGTWQGIYLVEHRDRPHRREVVLHLIGA
jgi:secondary thiamine-phosphate synthase enzyme